MKANLTHATRALLPTDIKQGLYDRSSVQCGIVHLGIGNFHRAHQAVYCDDVLTSGDMRWGITGVSLRSSEMRDKLTQQDGLYTLGVKDGEDTAWRVIGSVQSVLFAPDDLHGAIGKRRIDCSRLVPAADDRRFGGATLGPHEIDDEIGRAHV